MFQTPIAKANNMKRSTYLLFLAAALVAAGCSSVKTQVDTGPITARTFCFINTGSRELPSYADKRTQVHGMIQEAITKNLAAKGVNAVKSGGDLIVAYLVIAGNNVTTTSLNEYFGYGTDSTELVDKVHKEQAIKGGSRDYFEAGTLVIDFINPQTSKVLKRASVQAPILRNLAPDVRQARLQSLVDQALSDLRISH
jgi:hypothetical protein